MTEKERLIQEEEERFAEECRRHKERIAEIQKRSITGWNDVEPSAEAKSYQCSKAIETNACFNADAFDLVEKYAARISLYLRMSKWADENNGESRGYMWCLYCENHLIKISFRETIFVPMDIYFSSKEIAKRAIEKFGDEILKVWGDQ
jgi:hypothetical protein